MDALVAAIVTFGTVATAAIGAWATVSGRRHDQHVAWLERQLEECRRELSTMERRR